MAAAHKLMPASADTLPRVNPGGTLVLINSVLARALWRPGQRDVAFGFSGVASRAGTTEVRAVFLHTRVLALLQRERRRYGFIRSNTCFFAELLEHTLSTTAPVTQHTVGHVDTCIAAQPIPSAPHAGKSVRNQCSIEPVLWFREVARLANVQRIWIPFAVSWVVTQGLHLVLFALLNHRSGEIGCSGARGDVDHFERITVGKLAAAKTRRKRRVDGGWRTCSRHKECQQCLIAVVDKRVLLGTSTYAHGRRQSPEAAL